MLMNTGEKAITSKNNLLTTIAWQIDGKTEYALEGSVFIAGAVVQWLRDELKIIRTSAEVEKLAATGERIPMEYISFPLLLVLVHRTGTSMQGERSSD